jgi:DNA polymerase delta subunit 1
MKSSIYGYHGDQKSPYIRVTTKDPRNISKCKLKIETGIHVAGLDRPCQADTTFESNLAYILRFMIDCKVPGSNWIELPATTWKFVNHGSSSAQFEVETR